MGINYDILSASAAKKADTNINANIALLQMVSEMRDWEAHRFNAVIDRTVQIVGILDQQNQKMNDLQAQVAALQKRLYDQEEKDKNKGIAR